MGACRHVIELALEPVLSGRYLVRLQRSARALTARAVHCGEVAVFPSAKTPRVDTHG
jgi:hypothetical protein